MSFRTAHTAGAVLACLALTAACSNDADEPEQADPPTTQTATTDQTATSDQPTATVLHALKAVPGGLKARATGVLHTNGNGCLAVDDYILVVPPDATFDGKVLRIEGEDDRQLGQTTSFGGGESSAPETSPTSDSCGGPDAKFWVVDNSGSTSGASDTAAPSQS